MLPRRWEAALDDILHYENGKEEKPTYVKNFWREMSTSIPLVGFSLYYFCTYFVPVVPGRIGRSHAAVCFKRTHHKNLIHRELCL